ncbi:glycosyltransferase family 39 protein [Hymenobacter sp. BT175]|uniref:ArnT family glycosyltransferase n=1 Tax=Hymenobacter translucens TaxID=2886507 RepID=UPI001D0E11CA|nr:glycosyltransferase family 39 protein [Hymenobacter translucens]MCC2545873.1 glycosyltransferase family 39 protein [Hymenobacter translucens]
MPSSLSSQPPAWQRWLPLALLLLFSYLPLFWLLGGLPVQQWDEARTGLNGLNIWTYNDWIVLRHIEKPDLWNSKPPLWPWLLAFSFKALGATELGLRLPAAVAGLATVLLVYRAGSRWLGGPWAGFVAGMVLLTSQGYVHYHVTRSGDFDALLTLWTTAGALNWLAYLRTGRQRWAWAAGGAFALALLTKGIAGLLFAPGLLLATYLTHSARRLRRASPWLAISLVVLVGVIWYSGRELAAPGYLLNGVWKYEVAGPATEQMEGHYHPFGWYISEMSKQKFAIWLLAALLGGLLGRWLPAGSRNWWLVRYVGTVALTFLLVISIVQTKLSWYDAPVYPLLALLAAAGLGWVGKALESHLQAPLTRGIRIAGILLLVALPYVAQLQHIRDMDTHRLERPQLQYGRHLREQVRQMPHVQQYILATDGSFNDSPAFYAAAARFQYGHEVTRADVWSMNKGRPGLIVMACGAKAYRPWMKHFTTEILVRSDSCLTFMLMRYR